MWSPRLKPGVGRANANLESMKQILAVLIGGLATPCLAFTVYTQSPSVGRVQAHGYYLFLAQAPNGCEDCYVPLLVTQTRLEDLARDKRDEQAIVLTTYERDSIVGSPRVVVVSAAAVQPQERHVTVLDRRYRYQEISASEALSLLEHPGGVIAISRILSMRIPSADELADLLARFRAAKQ
jgi:hypothetical protein